MSYACPNPSSDACARLSLSFFIPFNFTIRKKITNILATIDIQ